GGLLRGPDRPPGLPPLVCHVLLVETEAGLVLVESGFGQADIEQPARRLGGMFMRMTGPALDTGETALARVRELGFDPNDVRHVLLTHLDIDHAGGIADFPQARIHVLADEYEATLAGRSLLEKTRYRPAQWSHGPDWALHQPDGEAWQGFAAARDLPGLPPEILMIPLAGHTRGHAGIAVQGNDGWLLHAGDAYFDHGQMATQPSCPLAMRAFQHLVCEDRPRCRDNIERLRSLALDGTAGVRVFCAHDPLDLARLSG
ncbi:unnamed protein product, partial [Chrysoparadoxa australica]